MWSRVGFAIALIVAAALALFAISIVVHPWSSHAAGRCGVEPAVGRNHWRTGSRRHLVRSKPPRADPHWIADRQQAKRRDPQAKQADLGVPVPFQHVPPIDALCCHMVPRLDFLCVYLFFNVGCAATAVKIP